MHYSEHTLAQQVVTLRDGLEPVMRMNETYQLLELSSQRFRVIDWWDRMAGVSWRKSNSPVAIEYDARRKMDRNLPDDDNVVYGLTQGIGCLIHMSEIEDMQTDQTTHESQLA